MRQPQFNLTDPPEETSHAAEVEPAVRQPREKPGVLVVDDEHMVRIMVQLGLERNGFDVWLARNGREAIDLYRGHAEEIAVVLLDVCMPGLDGLATLEVLARTESRSRGVFHERRIRSLPTRKSCFSKAPLMSFPSRSDWTTSRTSSGSWRIKCPPIFARPAGYADGEPGKKPYRGAADAHDPCGG